jgi:membrane protein YqaA with SNARE-associated domain
VGPALSVLTNGVSELSAHAADLGFGAAAMLCLGLSFVSAVVPWVNAEVLVFGLSAIARSRSELVVWVCLATAGQMAGKCIVYYAGRRGTSRPSGRTAALLDRWRTRASRRPWSPVALVAISSIVGIPPFYVMSAVAGALRMNIGTFLIAGTCGRLARFGMVAIVGFGL